MTSLGTLMKRRQKEQLSALGYRKVSHSGVFWLANEEGARLITGIEDWSAEGLAGRETWKSWKKTYHVIYLANEPGFRRYIVKDYPPKVTKKRVFGRSFNRARNEFWNTLSAYKAGIRTVLPVAFGERLSGRSWGIIVYPFLDDGFSVDRMYVDTSAPGLTVGEKQRLEKAVGMMLRVFIDRGMFPRDFALDQFLAVKNSRGELPVYWVDLERVKFVSFFTERSGTMAVASLLAQMEWLRNWGYPVRRSSMMRIARAYLESQRPGRLDRTWCGSVIQQGREIWHRRRFNVRQPGRKSDLRAVQFTTPGNAEAV
jgi:hypothetical protein